MVAAATPENIALARNFGIVLLVLLVPALACRTTWFRGVIRRADDPRGYWVAIGCQAALGLFCAVGGLLQG